MKQSKKLAAGVLLALTMTGLAAAQERIGIFVLQPERNAVKLEGPIALDTSSAFDTVLARMPNVEILELDSPGGNVMSALDIANKVSALGLSTRIGSTQGCASACSLIFLAGKSRQAIGRLGVHQLSSPGEGNLAVVQFVIADVLDAFQRFGVDSHVTKLMLTTSPADMYYFSDFEKDDYRINRKEELKPVAVAKADAAPELKFADYAARETLNGKIRLPDFKKDEFARSYRTRIREGMSKGPNFAGHYSLIEIGCGTDCRFVILVDTNSGKLIDFPLGGEDNYDLGMTYTVESSLLKAVWRDIERDLERHQYDRATGFSFVTCVKQDYHLDGDKVKLLRESRYTIEGEFCDTYQ